MTVNTVLSKVASALSVETSTVSVVCSLHSDKASLAAVSIELDIEATTISLESEADGRFAVALSDEATANAITEKEAANAERLLSSLY